MPQFRTKARAVDLLGKGQIADLPTAISELWKNGYDAYADNLEAFLYMPGYDNYQEPIFVLSDDGKGMDDQDILDKWFVLGTDSKSRYDVDTKNPDTTLDKEPRVKMGEKGIGRLAVAYLGPQMLMLTKCRKKPLEIVFFDWRILENYDLFLSDINIPTRSLSSADSFEQVFQELKEEFLLNFPEVTESQRDPWRDQLGLKEKIISDCNSLNIPDYIVENHVQDLLVDPTKSHATRFVIFQPDEQILQLRNFTKRDGSKDNDDEGSENHTISTLAGLFNLFKTDDPPYKTNLWIYENDETGRHDLLTHRAFFEPEDFIDCDHLIEGEFDAEGNFVGKVRIYNKTIDHKFSPLRKKGNSSYGPFSMKIGYVNYKDDETIVTQERQRVFEDKLNLYSGLFIYRDGFRVLPYGRVDTDFLEFENRRSQGAGTYFFSKRRLFGYLEISRAQNGRLIDKSSREGFINNQAYRDFRTDLISFFKDLAKKYFATKAEYGYKREQQEDLKEKFESVKEEHEKDKEARRNFAKALTQTPKDLADLQNEFRAYLAEIQKKSQQTNLAYEEISDLVSKIEDCKAKIAKYKISAPARFKPTDLQKKKFSDFTKIYTLAIKEFEASDEILKPVRDKLKVHELFREFEDRATFYQNTLARQYTDYDGELANLFTKIKSEFNSEKEMLLNEFSEKYSAIIPDRSSATEISRSMKLLESIFRDSQERVQKRISPYLEHLSRLSFDVNEDNLVGYYKDQFEEMKEEWNKTYELAQLGIAVEIIDHQFNTLYAQMAENIKNMEPHLVEGRESGKEFRNLSNAFEHLQDNYKLLQPLYRTTGKIRTDINGLELKEYIEDFFDKRLRENNITFTISDQGKSWSAYSYESIFKPVLINVINNALFWLQHSDKKEIRIDAEGDKLIIMNSGEKINDYILEDIFKLFYSERPKGRGIGLYLAKQSLNGIGYDIIATNDENYNKLNGACFIIKPYLSHE